jgi:hypothetical protein
MPRSAVGIVLQQIRGGGSGRPANPSGESVTKRFNALGPAIKSSLAAKGPDLARVQTLAVAVNGYLKNKDFVRAGGALDELEPLLTASPDGGAAEARTVIPTGKVAAEVLRGEIETIRLTASRGLSELVGKLKAEPDPKARTAETLVGRVSQALPSELEAALKDLDAAVKADDVAGAVHLRGRVQNAAKDWLTYLQVHAHEIKCCEDNPWGVKVDIDKPVRASLAAIIKATR